MGSPAFRFDADTHEYRLLPSGEKRPHITGMLYLAGLVDDTWFTEESAARGTAVHKLTADYDLGAFRDVERCTSDYKGWLLAHVAAMRIIQPTFYMVEEPRMHGYYLFGGRPDRVGNVFNTEGVLEVKSGPPHPSHRIQTALQAILVADDLHLPPDAVQRFVLYLQSNGKWKVEQHKDRRDFDRARGVIRLCC